MKAKSYGGTKIYDIEVGAVNKLYAENIPPGPVFLSPQWKELYRYAIKEADRTGIELNVNLGTGWNPGGLRSLQRMP